MRGWGLGTRQRVKPLQYVAWLQVSSVTLFGGLVYTHTSGFTLHVCITKPPLMIVYVCLRPYTRRFCIQIFYQDQPHACMKHVRATARVQHRRPRSRTTEVEAHVATYFWFVLLPTINGRPLTGSTNMDSG